MRVPRKDGGAAPKVRAQMDRFVEGLLMGLGSTQAAVFAGVSAKSAPKTGYKYRTDPYVRERFAKLREKLTRDEICSFAEQALDVKSIAFDECRPADTRLRGHALLARLMGHEAASKFEGSVNGGVLLIPVAASMDSWESQAIAAQAQLKAEVEQDATK